jgi:hypothetical protein
MKRRLQVVLTDEAWNAVTEFARIANENFEAGSVNYSDVINEMVLTSNPDVKSIQQKCHNVRRLLRALAAKKDIDAETALKILNDLKPKTAKKSGKTVVAESEAM